MANETSVIRIGTGAGTDKLANVGAALVNDAGLQILFYGACTTRDTVRAEALNAAIGAVYLSSAGKIYQKIANAGATADWVKVTATAAD